MKTSDKSIIMGVINVINDLSQKRKICFSNVDVSTMQINSKNLTHFLKPEKKVMIAQSSPRHSESSNLNSGAPICPQTNVLRRR